ncbi:MAG: DnaJ domain-containing protein [Chitinophagales bacterium]|nr:DnaJ domain-containing protein [Chitinophagales bacterium]MDW8273443.1 DnaJ domain-containing protein [Chitinophagales bacterium]
MQHLDKSSEAEIAAALAPLIAEVISRTGISDNALRICNQFFSKHFLNVSFQNIKSTVQRYHDSGAQPFVKISCMHLVTLIDAESCNTIIKFFLELASADDFIQPRKLRLIQRISNYLGIRQEDFDQLKTEFISRHNPYSLLELDSTATLDEVKKAYRKMALRFHPDKACGEEKTKEAEEKFRQIKAAYDAIMKGYEIP